MAEYKPELDERLSTVAECVIGNLKYKISIYRYNGGEMKIAYEYVFGLRADGTEAAKNINTRLPVEVARFFSENTPKALDEIDKLKGGNKAAKGISKAATSALTARKQP